MDVMLTLGDFPFMIKTAAYDTLKRSFQYKWAELERLPHPKYKTVGIGGAALQYMGLGSQTISLNGTIYPRQRGMESSLVTIRAMAGTGKPKLLMSFEGDIMGKWIIKQVDETKNEYAKINNKVVPRKIEFSIELQRFVDYAYDAGLSLEGGGVL